MDIYPVSTEDIWLLWGHLGTDEHDFDPFLYKNNSKWNTNNEVHGAAETTPQAASQTLISHAPGAGLRELIDKLPQIIVMVLRECNFLVLLKFNPIRTLTPR